MKSASGSQTMPLNSVISGKNSVISGFNLTTCDSYFTILVEVFTNHILAENPFHESYRMNKMQDYGLRMFFYGSLIQCFIIKII